MKNIKKPKIIFKQSKDFDQNKVDWAFDFIIETCLDMYKQEKLKKKGKK